MPDIDLTPKAKQQLHDAVSNEQEAFALLALINAEFQTDPMSVQCFDLRIVERVKACLEKHKENLRRNPWMVG